MRLKRLLLIAGVALLLLGLGLGLFFAFYRGPSTGPAGLPTVVAAVGNTCVECHRLIPEGTLAGHTFREWEESVHAAQGVACEACHGGDPTKGKKDEAHVGALPSTDPQSTVYFQRIPETCGKCHSPEFERFKGSVHYVQLEEEGRGPNCVTCHGAMAISILTPEGLRQTCSACHNERLGIRPEEPIKARYLLIMSLQVKAYLEAAKELVELKGATEEAGRLLDQAEGALGAVRQDWHTFLLDRIEEEIQRAFTAVQEAVKRTHVEE